MTTIKADYPPVNDPKNADEARAQIDALKANMALRKEQDLATLQALIDIGAPAEKIATLKKSMGIETPKNVPDEKTPDTERSQKDIDQVNATKAHLEEIYAKREGKGLRPKEVVAQFLLEHDLVNSMPSGFENLSELKQFYVIENLKKRIVDIVKSDAETQYSSYLKNKVGKSFLGKIKAGINKEFELKNFESEAFEQLLNSEEGKKLISQDFALLSKSVKDLRIGYDEEDNTLKIFHILPHEIENCTPAEEQMIHDFNIVANRFREMPYEWGQEDKAMIGGNKRKYEKAKREYDKAKEEILKIKAQREGKANAMVDLHAIDSTIKMEQLLTTHPEFEKEFNRLSETAGKEEKRKTVGKFINLITGKNWTNRGLIVMGAGFRIGAKGAALASKMTGMTAIIGAGVGGIIGSIRGGIKGKDIIKQTEKEARHGVIGEKQKVEIQKAAEAEDLTARMETMIAVLEKDITVAEREGHLDQIKRRIQYTQMKIEGGLINFGDAKSALVNEYNLLDSLNRAMVASTLLEGTTRTDIDKRLNQFLSKKKEIVDEAQAKFIKKQMLKGAALGAGLATFGYVVKWASEYINFNGIGNWFKGLGGMVNDHHVDTAHSLGHLPTHPNLADYPKVHHDTPALVDTTKIDTTPDTTKVPVAPKVEIDPLTRPIHPTTGDFGVKAGDNIYPEKGIYGQGGNNLHPTKGGFGVEKDNNIPKVPKHEPHVPASKSVTAGAEKSVIDQPNIKVGGSENIPIKPAENVPAPKINTSGVIDQPNVKVSSTPLSNEYPVGSAPDQDININPTGVIDQPNVPLPGSATEVTPTVNTSGVIDQPNVPLSTPVTEVIPKVNATEIIDQPNVKVGIPEQTDIKVPVGVNNVEPSPDVVNGQVQAVNNPVVTGQPANSIPNAIEAKPIPAGYMAPNQNVYNSSVNSTVDYSRNPGVARGPNVAGDNGFTREVPLTKTEEYEYLNRNESTGVRFQTANTYEVGKHPGALNIENDPRHLETAQDLKREIGRHNFKHNTIIEEPVDENGKTLKIDNMDYTTLHNAIDHNFSENEIKFNSYEMYERERELQTLFGDNALDPDTGSVNVDYFRSMPEWKTINKIPAKYFFEDLGSAKTVDGSKLLNLSTVDKDNIMKLVDKGIIKYHLVETNGKTVATYTLANQTELLRLSDIYSEIDPKNADPIGNESIVHYIDRMMSRVHETDDGTLFILKPKLESDLLTNTDGHVVQSENVSAQSIQRSSNVIPAKGVYPGSYSPNRPFAVRLSRIFSRSMSSPVRMWR